MGIYIIGTGMTRFGRLPDLTVKDMTALAVNQALRDAGVPMDAVEAAYFANTAQGYMEGQTFVRGQLALRDMGFEDLPIVNVENACASGSTALNLAVQHIAAGRADVVLAVGAEKLFNPDKAKMLSLFDSGWDISTVEENKRHLLALGEGVEPPPGTMSERPYSVFMDVYAAFCRFHMREFGTTQRQIAAVAAKNHQHSVENELAQYREPMTVDEVMAAPPISYPLTLPMCSPISDGAAAAVVCNEAGLKRFAGARNRAIRVRASVLQSGVARAPEDYRRHITVLAARKAYEEAGIAPEDVSVAEVHDATAMGEIIQSENLGFFAFGEGGPAAERGDTAIGGRIPINPSGGLESKGHPIAATGLGQIHELVSQLRGEAGKRQVAGAQLALAENGGGLYGVEEAVAAITILSK
ncbi:thiolase family protein [Futiania mangrovi]|uniref:Thiolase family protein n=1 Tax=Futiania mangrovi TaxID=2959716 RepID=A0A9J6PCE6_9PROT|nr:thiolase family protein [Futiania mangrovii]MCP1335464.1 thiolase family protein [Futiania mangrovii]